MVVQPVVEGLYPATKGVKLVVFPEALDAHSVDSLQSTRSTGLGNKRLRWMDGTIERGDEPLVVILGEPDRPVRVPTMVAASAIARLRRNSDTDTPDRPAASASRSSSSAEIRTSRLLSFTVMMPPVRTSVRAMVPRVNPKVVAGSRQVLLLEPRFRVFKIPVRCRFGDQCWRSTGAN